MGEVEVELLDRFDRVKYNDFVLTNILRRTKVVQTVLNRIDVYHDYVIKEGERADTIAYDYYGSSTYTWLVYMCNNIYDPYYQWPLTDRQMYAYITRKYGDYYQTQVDIKHYINPNKEFSVSPETFAAWDDSQRFGWVPQTFYEFEVEMNEKKRTIKLISNKYLPQINQEIKQLYP